MRSLIALAIVSAGCSRAVSPLIVPNQSAVVLSGGPNTSMTYLARTSGGVLAIDLGWSANDEALTRALRTLGASAADVRWVFLTHSHRDHVGAWPMVRHARIYIAAAEESLLVAGKSHGGWIPRAMERIDAAHLPRAGELAVSTFSQDTTIVIGADTLRAYLVPGHTPGSVVYLFRGILFLGDAVTSTVSGGFAPARRGFSSDPKGAAKALAQLWPRLPSDAVRYACTAHARCAAYTPAFLKDVAR